VTLRLFASAKQYWPTFDGWAASRGIDPMDLPVDRFLNLVYHFLTRNGTQEEIDKVDRTLWMPPKGVAVSRGPWSKEAEAKAFDAFAAEFSGM